ncbi:MaoC family dehydratase [Paeniroseomonas aquatica]|uniref:MaoC family dehydratase n=1 Tax=Paeniroseomonas aquatica TaxID=373043 RepID=UPI00361F723B
MSGLYFEEFEIGQLFQHRMRRTITEADNVFFSALTHNPAALHLDEEYCRTETEFGQRIVNSAFTLGLMVGITVGDTTLGTTVANLGWDEVRFPSRCSTATPSGSRPRCCRSGRANRGQGRGSSNSCTGPSTRRASWWRIASVPASCWESRHEPADPVLALRAGRQRTQAGQGPRQRRRRADPRPRGFGGPRAQAGGAGDGT